MQELRGFRYLGPYLAELGNEFMSVLTQSLCSFHLTMGHILIPLLMIPYNVLVHLERLLKSFKRAKLVSSYFHY